MNKEWEEKLVKSGVDVKVGLYRFSNNAELYIENIKMFSSDPILDRLANDVAKRDAQQTEMDAHTLKGAAGSLGFNGLYTLCDKMVKALRSGNEEEAYNLYPSVEETYEKIITAIKEEH